MDMICFKRSTDSILRILYVGSFRINSQFPVIIDQSMSQCKYAKISSCFTKKAIDCVYKQMSTSFNDLMLFLAVIRPNSFASHKKKKNHINFQI